MKLYTTDASPFGARVRIQIYKKDLPVDIVPPPGGMGSEQLKSLSPIGKIPILDLGQSVIIESEVIQEYLEDKFPSPSLRGDTAEIAASSRTLSRLTDLYLLPALLPFRSYLKGESVGRNVLEQCAESLQNVFSMFEYFMSDDTFAVSDKLTLADCAMAPMFYFTRFFAEAADVSLTFTAQPRLEKWLNEVRSDEAVDKVLKEIEATR